MLWALLTPHMFSQQMQEIGLTNTGELGGRDWTLSSINICYTVLSFIEILDADSIVKMKSSLVCHLKNAWCKMLRLINSKCAE